MVFAQIASIVCEWFDLFRYQGCSGEVEGCYFQRSMLAEEVIFCPRIWSVFSQACIFPAGKLTQQEASRVVRMGLQSCRDYYRATCGPGSVFRNGQVDESNALLSTVVNIDTRTRVSNTGNQYFLLLVCFYISPLFSIINLFCIYVVLLHLFYAVIL